LIVPFLGGFRITKAGWAGANAVYVEFVSDSTTELFQLYAGRTLIGCTARPTERRVVGQLFASDAPYPLSIMRVTPLERLTDFGSLLPPFPWNRFRLGWSVAAPSADIDHFDVLAAPDAGEPFSEKPLAAVPYRGVGDYSFTVPPIGRSGAWAYEIVPRDDAKPLGNAGTPLEVEVDALVPPPDVTPDADGNRFDLTVDAGNLVASFDY
jgi:hypothetical protein